MLSHSSNDSQPVKHARFARNVVFKAIILFTLFNGIFAVSDPIPALGRISAYNHIFPGRQRLPYGDNPDRAYNLSLYQLDAMFASHKLAAGPKPADEFRVILIGDSSTWGFLLQPDQTLAAYLNAAEYVLPDGRRIRTYNLGYPVMSLTKDVVILALAMRYQPDLLVWSLTLESFPYDKQLFPPLLQNNPKPVRDLIYHYDLDLDPNDPGFVEDTFISKTIIGQRRSLADLLRLQLYGVMWAATGVDQDIPETYTPRMEDLPADKEFHNLYPPTLSKNDLALDVLRAGADIAGSVPLLFINEPMFISQGENSDIRYNYFYPRWAYDAYRRIMTEQSQSMGWFYLDLWDAIPSTEFTNSAVHLTPKGSALFAELVGGAILDWPNLDQ